MLFSTFLTLILVPVVYTLLARFTSASLPGEEPEQLTASERKLLAEVE
jgi:hypothetical protein